MSAALIVIGVLVLFFGFAMSSQATAGVYLAAAACFLGICARMAQASEHHHELIARDRLKMQAAADSVSAGIVATATPHKSG